MSWSQELTCDGVYFTVMPGSHCSFHGSFSKYWPKTINGSCHNLTNITAFLCALSHLKKKHGFPEFPPSPTHFHCSGLLFRDHIRRCGVTPCIEDQYTLVLYPSEENRKECAKHAFYENFLNPLLCTHRLQSSVKIRLSHYHEVEWRQSLWHVHIVATVPVSFIMSVHTWKHDSH